MVESTTFFIVADGRMTAVFFYDPCNTLHTQTVNAGGGFHRAESSSAVCDGFRVAGVFGGDHNPIGIPTVTDREIDLFVGRVLCSLYCVGQQITQKGGFV